MVGVDDIDVRRAEPADRTAVLALLGDAQLRWGDDDASAALFAWKHDESPFGPSPAWVAVAGSRVVGFRTFSRWEFERGGRHLRAARAVDTATAPDFQGRGIFSRLTKTALHELADEGVSFIFNTPNASSLPGYLKMGWEEVGRLPVAAQPRGLVGVARLRGARTAAEKWSSPVAGGEAAAEVLDDAAAVARLLGSLPPATGLRTARTPASLSWRYGFGPLHYRAVLAGRSVEDGLALFRVRGRGSATEAAIVELLVPGGDRRSTARLLRRAVIESAADYGLRLGPAAVDGSVPVPGQGPLLVWRALADAGSRPDLKAWQLSLGDVELF